jgi:hypothetical protein
MYLYSITTNQAAIISLFRVINQHVGNLPPMPGVFPDYPAPVVRQPDGGLELIMMMRWGRCLRRRNSVGRPLPTSGIHPRRTGGLG